MESVVGLRASGAICCASIVIGLASCKTAPSSVAGTASSEGGSTSVAVSKTPASRAASIAEYDRLADSILEARTKEVAIVRKIVAATFADAEKAYESTRSALEAGDSAKARASAEDLATLIAQIGTEGDADVARVRKRLVEGGHHFNPLPPVHDPRGQPGAGGSHHGAPGSHHAPGEQPPAHHAEGQAPGHHAEGQAPGHHAEGQAPAGHAAGGHAAGDKPADHAAGGHAAGDKPAGHAAGDKPAGHATGDKPAGHAAGGHAAGDKPAGHATGEQPAGHHAAGEKPAHHAQGDQPAHHAAGQEGNPAHAQDPAHHAGAHHGAGGAEGTAGLYGFDPGYVVVDRAKKKALLDVSRSIARALPALTSESLATEWARVRAIWAEIERGAK